MGIELERAGAVFASVVWIPSSPWSIRVPPVLDAQDDNLSRFVEHAVENSIGAPPSRPDADEVVTEWLSHGLRLHDQRGGQEVDDRRSDGLGESVADRSTSRRREDELVLVLAA